MKRILAFSTFLLFAALVGFSLAGLSDPPFIGIPPGSPGRYVMVDGLRLRVEQRGEGPDLLLIHGCPGSIEDWDPVIGELAQRYRVTAYDRPGHGYSDSRDGGFTLAYNAKIAFGLIEELRLKDPVVVGHSYGSATALAMAVDNPSNLRAFVLTASPGYGPVDVDRISYVLSWPYFGAGFARVAGGALAPRIIRAGIANGFGPNADKIPGGFVDLRIRMWAKPKAAVARAKELTNLERDLVGISPRYGGIRKPVFIVQGRQDEITKAAWLLHNDIPESQLTVLEAAGHYLQFAYPTEVVAVIDQAAKIKIAKRGPTS